MSTFNYLTLISNFKFQISNSQQQSGFTLVEIIISTAIILVLGIVVLQVYTLIINQSANYRQQTVVTSLADQYMEIARNLPYSQIGTVNGNPHGSLPDATSPTNTTVNGVSYQIYYEVTYVDDPADGTIAAGTDPAPDDYKQVKLNIKNTATNYVNTFLTTIVPQGLEGLASGGALAIQVFNAEGQPVSDATVQITNTALSPDINLTRATNANGTWTEVGLPDSANSYHIVVTKNGYSTDQTYPSSQQNPSPIKPDATIANGQVTQISFSIDLLSNLTFNIQNQVCTPLNSVGLLVYGSKLIGTPNVLKFSNTYASNSSGQVNLNNIEWDSYTPQLTGSSYMIYGTSPAQQANILPNTNETFTLIIGPDTTNSLLVTVKDASTSNPIEGASVQLQSSNPSYDSSGLTGGSILSQQNWSAGSGQANFTNPDGYYSDDGNINNSATPSGITLAQINGSYASSGTLTSSTFDTGAATTGYTTITWLPSSQNPSTNIKFQIATNNDNATWNYVGPDGTANTYYTVPGTTISAANSNERYLRYKAFLSTSNPSVTPMLTSVNINYVAGCFTPGQTMFAGLSAGNNYQAIVSAGGYQTQTISNINISGYNTLQVLLSQ